MRSKHIHQRVVQQYELRKVIKKVVLKLEEDGAERISSSRIKTRRDFMKEQWHDFKTNHRAIIAAIDGITEKEKTELLQRSYFQQKHFESTQSTYIDGLERANELIDCNHASSRESASSRFSTNTGETSRVIHHAPRLPQLDFPKFNGSMLEWLPFRVTFEKMVVKNDAVEAVYKAHYLKAAMIGSAAHFLNSTTVTAENFQRTWEQLIDFYHNERVLLQSALHAAATIKKMNRESAAELEHLYSTIKQIRNTLELLSRSMPGIDDFLIYFTSQRFDPETLKAWELHLGAAKVPPLWDQLASFILSRLLTLKSYEHSTNPKSATSSSTASSGIKVHLAETAPHHQSQTRTPPPCVLCSEEHFMSRCPVYMNKPIEKRTEVISRHNLCFNCLGRHHSNSCFSTRRCLKCGKKHHTSLHHQHPAKPITEPTSTVHTNHASVTQMQGILLATAKLLVTSAHGEQTYVRALIDQGSEASLVSERIVQLLRLTREPSSTHIIGIGGYSANRTRGTTLLEVQAHFDPSKSLSFRAHILPKLTNASSATRQSNVWPHLQGLKLADPEFCITGAIDILLGADVYGQILEEGIIKGGPTAPTAQLTKFGWIVSGPSGSHNEHPMLHTFHLNIDADLNEKLQRFWTLDEVPNAANQQATPADQECENHFLTTHSRDKDGRYIVRLPFKSPPSDLGESKSKAQRMLHCLHRKFNLNPIFQQSYADFIKEYEQLQHLVPVSTSAPEPEVSCYLPHHGVLKDSSLTTKLRVVFNGSSTTSSGKSLNDILHSGGKLQTDLFDVLLFFRLHRYVFSGDIEKFYRQIKVHPDDWKFQRILWYTNSKIVVYELTTDTYGLACAAFLALRAFQQLIFDEGIKYPLALQALSRGRYVDDIVGGSNTIEEARTQIDQIINLCMAGGFPIQKWISNHPDTLSNVPQERLFEALSKPMSENTTVYALGLAWQPKADTFHFTIKLEADHPITKRKVLSAIARIFDPLGLLSPVVVVAKTFVQELWTVKLDWDEELSQDSSRKWNEYLQQLHCLEQLSIPRWLQLTAPSTFEVHGFCDASQKAIAAVIYVRTSGHDGPTITLLCAKTKVAPLKRLTIPRLELCAAVLLARLLKHVISSMKWDNSPVYCWTDSSIAYTWINNHPSRWKEFVHNRVNFIQEATPTAQWRFVPGKINPADCATRGLTASELLHHSLWWNGPTWLLQNPESWPSDVYADFATEHLEERPVAVNVIAQVPEPTLHQLFNRADKLPRLIRSTVIFDRAISRFKKQRTASLLINPISPGDLEAALIYWIKQVQAAAFHPEIQIIQRGDQLSKSNPLVRLTPWLDPAGILRVGGRLQNSSLNSDTRHPIILPRRNHLSTLVIRDAHHQTLHGGTQLTLAYVRNKYWILGGRAPVRSLILRCVRCARFRQQRAQQLMAPLPLPRVTRSRAFLHTGVDYAGPFTIKTWRGKAAKTYKGYLALFVCLSTSAVHLELVSDYTADTFIAAYKRFIARRGICSVLYSDCGTNFKGADHEIKRLFSAATNESMLLGNLLGNLGTQWKFNPPSAPHFGGKWEAGVKSVKHHLRRVIGDHFLTFEEMTTLLTQIEAALNSRPLCALTEDPQDLEALTPGHFLIGEALNVLPEPSLETFKIGRLRRWQLIRQSLDSFWSSWSNSCLQRYQAIWKWNRRTPNLKRGDMVLVVDERYPPAKWPLGRIIAVHPGNDGLIRTVTVRTQSSTIDRPIVKICPLPVNEEVI